MRKLLLAVMAALVFPAYPAFARRPVPIVDWPNQTVATASGNKLTLEQVAQAVTKAAFGMGWTSSKISDEQYVARRVVRGKHTVVVSISISPEQYSVTYQSSDNMKFEIYDGVRLIHPNYNVWVRELVEAIRLELSRL